MPRILFLAALVVVTAPSLAHAQRGARGGIVYGPDGPLYDTRSPEWQASRGDLGLYQQLMEQKMYRLQQQQMLKMQQQYQQAQKKNAKSGGTATAPSNMNSNNYNTDLSLTNASRRKKKRPTVAPTFSHSGTKPATSTKADAPKDAATKSSTKNDPAPKANASKPATGKKVATAGS